MCVNNELECWHKDNNFNYNYHYYYHYNIFNDYIII